MSFIFAVAATLVFCYFIVGVAIYYFRELGVDGSSEKSGRQVYSCLCMRRSTVIPKEFVEFLLTSLPLEPRYFHGLLCSSHEPCNLSIRSRLLRRNLVVLETKIIYKGLEFFATCRT